MPALVAGIHVFNCQAKKVVDGRDKPAMTKLVCTTVDDHAPALTRDARAPKPAAGFLVATPDGKPVLTFLASLTGVLDGHRSRRPGRDQSAPLRQGSSEGLRRAR